MGILMSYFRYTYKCNNCEKKIFDVTFDNLCISCYYDKLNDSPKSKISEFNNSNEWSLYDIR